MYVLQLKRNMCPPLPYCMSICSDIMSSWYFNTPDTSRMSFGSLPLWSHVQAKDCSGCTPGLCPGHITVLQNGTEPLVHLKASFSTSLSCPLEAQFSELKVHKAAGGYLTNHCGRQLTGVDKRVSPLKSRRRGVRVWPVCPHPLFRLPAVEQLLPKPARQRLAHFVQQLGELNVVLMVILSQEGPGLWRKRMVSVFLQICNAQHVKSCSSYMWHNYGVQHLLLFPIFPFRLDWLLHLVI